MSEKPADQAAAYSFPSGHLGNLSENQKKAFDSFKQLCIDRNLVKPATDSQRASHDDGTILRYLRARRFDREGAYKQFKTTEDWRKENSIELLFDTIDVQEYEDTRRLYPQWVGRRDKRGMPVYVFEVAGLSPEQIAAYEQKAKLKNSKIDAKVPAKLLRLFALYENLIRFVTPWCTANHDRPHSESPITQGNNIIDITGVGLKQFWDLKSHLQDSSTLATANYPETLDRIFVIGAPSFFPTLWSWVKKWFDPIVVSKMFILSSHEVYSTLSQHIDPEDIPKKYGGKLDWSFGEMPKLEKGLEGMLEWQEGSKKGIPIGPVRWEEDEEGFMRMIAVGSIDGKERKEIIARTKTKWTDGFYPTGEKTEKSGGSIVPEGDKKQEATGVKDESGHSVNGGLTEEPPSKATAPGPPISSPKGEEPPTILKS